MKSASATRLLCAAGVATACVIAISQLSETDETSFSPEVRATFVSTIAAPAIEESADDEVTSPPSEVSPAMDPQPIATSDPVIDVVQESSESESATDPSWLTQAAVETWLTECGPKVVAVDEENQRKALEHFEADHAVVHGWAELIPGYVDEVLSLESKFRLATGVLQWNDSHRSHQFELLGEHLFNLGDINAVVDELTKRIERQYAMADDAAFVAARVDVPAEEVVRFHLKIEREELEACFQRILAAAEATSTVDAGVAVGTEIVSDQIADSIAHSLMDALGIERTYVSSTIVEELVQQVTDPLARSVSKSIVDPTVEFTAVVKREVSNIERILVVGSDGASGIAKQLLTFDEQRRAHRVRRIKEAYAAKGAF